MVVGTEEPVFLDSKACSMVLRGFTGLNLETQTCSGRKGCLDGRKGPGELTLNYLCQERVNSGRCGT